jgi:two-component system NarL family response regulator
LDAVRVLIADDDAPLRRVVSSVLSEQPDIEVVGEAADGEEAVALVTELAPQVVVMDIRMPKLSGIEAAAVLNEIHPATNVLMLTVSDEESDLFEAIRAGASGYLLKDTEQDQIVRAIRLVQGGQAVMSPPMAAKLRKELTRTVAGEHESVRPLLTKVELDVLAQLAKEASREAAATLGMPEAMVNHHLNNVLKKLHIHFRMERVAHAVREELTEIEQIEAENDPVEGVTETDYGDS